MPEILFWLLDINHKVANNKLEIRLWGKDNSGHSVLVTTGFAPYFYMLPKEEKDITTLFNEIGVLSKKYNEIVSVQLDDKKYFGKPVKTIKILCKIPEAIEKYSKLLTKTFNVKEHLEDDIRPATLFIIENGVSPSGWYCIEVMRASRSEVNVDQIFEVVKPPRQAERLQTPNLKMLSLSIFALGRKGSPDPIKDPIRVITIKADSGKTEQYVSDGEDDCKILERFISRICEIDPDIIVGYGQNTFDWPYLIDRAKKNKIKLSIDRSDSEPHRSVYGHISVTGRSNIDIADISEDLPEVKIKTLANLAEFLKIADRTEIDKYQESDAGELWKNPEKREILLEYLKRRSEISFKVAKVLLDSAIQMSNLTGLPLDQVAAAAVGFRVDTHLMMQAYRLNELIPRRIERPYIPYKGATVLEPKPGIHENIAVLDFTSMYPNLMIINNLSPDSYAGLETLPKNDVTVAPEVGYRFRKYPPGFFKQVLEHLITIRGDVRKKLSKTDPASVEHRVLKEREKAIKVITNACYGYAGWTGARWYVREVAESAAAFGRVTLKRVFKIVESLSLPIIYADTDSIFVEYDQSKVKELLRIVESDIGMEIKIDKIYSRVLFTEAKKKYAGLLYDGTLDIVGLEVVRGDWSNVAKIVQEKILELVLKEKGTQKAIDYLREFIYDLRLGKTPLSDLTIWKTLTKPVEDYEVKAPHVEAARMLQREGWTLRVGDKIGFVITKGKGRLYERVKPFSHVLLSQVDLEYYVTNQILPAAMRILGIFGIEEETVLGNSNVSSLSKYLKTD